VIDDALSFLERVDHVASDRIDVTVGLVDDSEKPLLADALSREVVVILTRQWATCPTYLLASDATVAFHVAGVLGGLTPTDVRGVSLANRAIADLTVDSHSEVPVLARFRRKLTEAGAQLVASPDHPGCIGAMFSPATPAHVLLDSSPFGEVLGMCCNEPRDLPSGVVFVRLTEEAPSLAAMAQTFTAIAASPEAVERRWMA
jgi:hypothetical protein